MAERVVSDPSQHGWIFENGKWVWGATGGAGGTGAGMVISDTEPADKVEGMQWLNPTNGLVLFWDGVKWLEMPGGKDGADGATYDDSWIQPALDSKLDSSRIVICTQDEYDALTPDANTLYFIV